jgi:hypothetical protein
MDHTVYDAIHGFIWHWNRCDYYKLERIIVQLSLLNTVAILSQYGYVEIASNLWQSPTGFLHEVRCIRDLEDLAYFARHDMPNTNEIRSVPRWFLEESQ